MKPQTPYVPKAGDVSIFPNAKAGDKRPDLLGYAITPEGRRLRIALWTKNTANGEFFSGKCQYEEEEAQPQPSSPYKSVGPEPSDLPF